MMYQISICDKVSNTTHLVSVDALNHQDAVKDAMLILDKKITHPAHLIENKRKSAPRL